VERLAVLRVVLLATDPQAVKVEVWRADALLLLAAVDRLAQRKEPAAQAHESVTGTLAGSIHRRDDLHHTQRRRRRPG